MKFTKKYQQQAVKSARIVQGQVGGPNSRAAVLVAAVFEVQGFDGQQVLNFVLYTAGSLQRGRQLDFGAWCQADRPSRSTRTAARPAANRTLESRALASQ